MSFSKTNQTCLFQKKERICSTEGDIAHEKTEEKKSWGNDLTSDSSVLSISSEEVEVVEATPVAKQQGEIPEGYYGCFWKKCNRAEEPLPWNKLGIR